VRASSHFAISILAEGQHEHSTRFAAKGEQARAAEVEFTEHVPGLPCLPDALATIACRVSALHPGGDHTIVVGEALSTSHAPKDLAPLLFFRGSYSRLERERAAERTRGAELTRGAERTWGAELTRAAERERAAERTPVSRPKRPAGLKRIATLERVG
jgi:flavin reductase (DIM6/NTAB) family NADH-FMN oxidoreductase RutF